MEQSKTNSIPSTQDQNTTSAVVYLQIWSVFSKPIAYKNSKELEKEVNKRHKLLQTQFSTFNRIEFFHIFNTIIMECFYRVVDGQAKETDFNFLLAMGFGTKQWSDESFNLMAAGELCGNLCLYCFITGIFNHYNWTDVKSLIKEIEASGVAVVSKSHPVLGDTNAYLEWDTHRRPFKLNPKKLAISWNKTKIPKLFMSPTNSDIFPENVDSFIAKWKELIAAGHYILIVSKPRMDCIPKICQELLPFQDKVAFRFTITTDNPYIMANWEIFAPHYAERLDCLEYAVKAGYRVSVSMEPFLSDPTPLVKYLSPFVDEIWIGMINGYPSEKVFGLPFCKELTEEIARVKAFYSFENINKIVTELRNNPKVYWKESIVKVYLKRWWKIHSYEKINENTITDLKIKAEIAHVKQLYTNNPKLEEIQ